MLRYIAFSLLALSLGMSINGFTHPLDSIGIEKKKGKIYILHKTEAKETFYSISRKYNVTVNVLKAENPEIASGLKVGHIIQVPYTGKIAKSKEPVKGKVESSTASASASNKSSNSSSKTHTVAPKETLYSISKKYHVTVDQLKKANGNSANSLQPGDKIIIPSKNLIPATPVASEGPKKVEKKEEPVPVAKPERQVVKTEVKPVAKPEVKQEERKREEPRAAARPSKEEQPSYKEDNETSFKKITENGVAELLDDKSGFHVGLHRTAPVGTIIQVKNNENNSKIFLRVIGKLESESNGRTILKMSPKAFERLGAKDKRVPVSLSYIL